MARNIARGYLPIVLGITALFILVTNGAGAQPAPTAIELGTDQSAVADAQAKLQKIQDQINSETDTTKLAQELAAKKQDLADVAAAQKKLDDDYNALKNGGSSAVAPLPNCVIDTAKFSTACFVTGPIVIPFRAELSGKKDILAGFSGGLFVGVNGGNVVFHDWLGFNSGFLDNTTLISFLAYSPSFSSTGPGGSSGSTANGGVLSIGAGVAFPIQWNTGINTSLTNHLGIVWGMDVTSTNNKYSYNGKSWISVITGWSF